MSPDRWRWILDGSVSPRAVATLHAVAALALAMVNAGWAVAALSVGAAVPGTWVQLVAAVLLLVLARVQWRRRSRM